MRSKDIGEIRLIRIYYISAKNNKSMNCYLYNNNNKK